MTDPNHIDQDDPSDCKGYVIAMNAFQEAAMDGTTGPWFVFQLEMTNWNRSDFSPTDSTPQFHLLLTDPAVQPVQTAVSVVTAAYIRGDVLAVKLASEKLLRVQWVQVSRPPPPSPPG